MLNVYVEQAIRLLLLTGLSGETPLEFHICHITGWHEMQKIPGPESSILPKLIPSGIEGMLTSVRVNMQRRVLGHL